MKPERNFSKTGGHPDIQVDILVGNIFHKKSMFCHKFSG